jgi:hypothetical protein
MHSRAAMLTLLCVRPRLLCNTNIKNSRRSECGCVFVMSPTGSLRRPACPGGAGMSHACKDITQLMGAEEAHAHVHVGAWQQQAPSSHTSPLHQQSHKLVCHARVAMDVAA